MNNLFKTLFNELQNGGAVILPTETVYGIASMENQSILYTLKQRPSSMKIAYAFSSKEQIFSVIESDNIYLKLAIDKLLPGPFTLLVHNKNGDKIGIRLPDNEKCIEFLKHINQPIILTSANLHKQPAATSYAQARNTFPTLNGIDGGVCKYGQASLIIDLTHNR